MQFLSRIIKMFGVWSLELSATRFLHQSWCLDANIYTYMYIKIHICTYIPIIGNILVRHFHAFISPQDTFGGHFHAHLRTFGGHFHAYKATTDILWSRWAFQSMQVPRTVGTPCCSSSLRVPGNMVTHTKH